MKRFGWISLLATLSFMTFMGCRPEPLPILDSGSIVVRFIPMLNGEVVEFGREGTEHTIDGRMVTFEEFRFYVAGMSLEDERGTLTHLSEIKLIDFEDIMQSNFRIGNLPLNSFEKIQFDIGVPPELNVSQWDPNLYGGQHPLNNQAMYFQEAGSYRFMDLVGFIDDGGSPNIFTYNPGDNSIFQRNISLSTNIELTVETISTIEIVIDLGIMLDGIDLIAEPKIQQSNNVELGGRLMRNLNYAISIN